MPSPVRALMAWTGTASAISSIATTASAGSAERSDLLRMTTGPAPLSKASTSSRSSRRAFGGWLSECTRKIVSTFAART